MPRDARFSTPAVDAESDAVTALLADGYMRLYSAPRPVTADDPPDDAQLIAEFRLGSPAFGPSAGGIAPALAVADVTTLTAGNVTWFRTLRSDGITAVFDGNAGTTDQNLVMSNTNLAMGALVSVVGFQYRSPRT